MRYFVFIAMLHALCARTLGEWTAISDHQIDGSSMAILQVDDYLMRTYRNSKGEMVNIYMGYFTSQREGKGNHSPRQFLPRSGWVPIEIGTCQMKMPGHNPESVQINEFIMGKGLDRQLYLFWYHGRGRVYASEYWNKIYLIWDALTKKRTDGALIRVDGLIGNVDHSFKRQLAFVELLIPKLN